MRLTVAAFLAGGMIGVSAALLVPSPALHAAPADDLAARKALFRRPPTVPFPADNPFSEAKRALGEALFHDKRLSVDGSLACASCHERGKGFADGKAQGRGVPGRALKRHTPTLWNLAWSSPVFWDGRARSLEEQVAGPIESPDEMALPMASAVARLAADPAMVRAFAEAFPATPRVDAANLAKAIATYERTFVSPMTRFDRWIDGDERALSRREVAGFRLFTGKAQCVKCHSGFAFTDYAFHDIGLPGDDRGRGAVLRLEVAEHAFKTPGLREIGRSAPYMHDGSLATLDAVIRHYAERRGRAADALQGPRAQARSVRGRSREPHRLSRLVNQRGTAGAAGQDRAGAERPGGAGGAGLDRVPGRQGVPSHSHCPSARWATVDRQQRHPHPQCPRLRPRARFRFRRAGAGRDGRDRASPRPDRSWSSAASIRRWSFTSTLRRRCLPNDQHVAGLPPCARGGRETI